jgi:UDP-N-acetylmuramoyl-tripeptide--D-alanyl-D-alanine ligase
MNIESLYELFLQHPSISTDSRSIKPGSLFFALSGDNFNGNRFAAEALDKGAACAIIDQASFKTHANHIVVENTQEALQSLAQYHRKQLKIPVLAITGSNGKTTTKELIVKVLQQKYRVGSTRGNLNNHIGVPLTLLEINRSHDIAVIEMGANHPGEIGFLCELTRPQWGIITNVGKAHLKGFGSFEGVIKTKKELYDYLAQHQGTRIINLDNAYLKNMAESSPTISFSQQSSQADLLVQDILQTPHVQVIWQKNGHTERHTAKSHLPGKFHWTNIMYAVASGVAFGIKPNAISKAIEAYIPSNNRSQLIHTKRNKVFLDAYNANPSSMRAALDYFLSSEPPHKMLIVGEMMELGPYADEEHQEIVDYIKTRSHRIEQVFLVGASFQRTNSGFSHYTTPAELQQHLEKKQMTGKYIFIKGSRGNKLETLIKYL